MTPHLRNETFPQTQSHTHTYNPVHFLNIVTIDTVATFASEGGAIEEWRVNVSQ